MNSVHDTLLGLGLALVGYLSGSVPYGLVLPKLFLGVDVRTIGSGNIGATNAARAGGKVLGVAVFVLDVAKAVIPILVARALLENGPSAPLWIMATAVAAFVGHLFPVWLRFKGGKGVATGFGIFLVLSPFAAMAGLGAYLLLYAVTRISSVGSLAGTLACSVCVFVQCGMASPIAWAGAAIAALIWWRHRDNVRRLIRGEEQRRMKV
jgi:acyl phosphate:glycerol-3-phosphate acyltransferase